MKRKGFTLIELLVVIAVIAILASILFPVFAKAREKARQIGCASNIRNAAMALRMYAQDCDERLPWGIPSGFTCTGAFGFPNNLGWPNGAAANNTCCAIEHSCGWAFSATPYIKNDQVLTCSNYSRFQFGRNRTPPDARWWSSSYLFSTCLVGANEAEIANPSGKVMLSEQLPFHFYGNINIATQGADNNTAKPDWQIVVAFADGHVKFVNLNNAIGNESVNGCFINNAGLQGTGFSGGAATKWNFNSGWDPSNNPNWVCGAGGKDTSPFGSTGRQGANF